MKITQAFLKGLKPKDKQYAIYEDNLNAVVNPSGRITLYLRYSAKGKKHRMRFGSIMLDMITPATVKKLDTRYREKLAMLYMDGDPVGQQDWWADIEEQHQKAKADRIKFYDVCQQYLDQFTDRASFSQERGYIRNHICRVIKNRPIADVARADLTSVVDTVASEGKRTTAGHCARCLSRIWKFARDRGFVDSREIARELPTPKTKSRERFLSDKELAKVLPGFTRELHWLIRTGVRVDEMLSVKREDIDDDYNWTFKAKGGVTRVKPLPKALHGCIDAIEAGTLFPTRLKRAPSRNVPYDALRALLSDAGIKDCTLHDLRRTCLTFIDRHHGATMLSVVAGHARKGLHGVYGRWEYHDEQLQALEHWGAHLDQLAGI